MGKKLHFGYLISSLECEPFSKLVKKRPQPDFSSEYLHYFF